MKVFIANYVLYVPSPYLCPLLSNNVFYYQTYFSAASELHGTQMKALLSADLDLVKKAADDDLDQGKAHHLTMYL